MSSGPFTLRKLMLHSVATALATRVFPVPTGQQPSLFMYVQLCTIHHNSPMYMTKGDRMMGGQADTAVATKLGKLTSQPVSRTFWLDTLD